MLRHLPALEARPAALAAAALLCAALPAQSQSASTLERVVVSAARVPLPAGQVAADVVVIDAETIRASSADSIEDLLRRHAGLLLSRSGGPGANAALFVRGAGASNTLVLIDGVRIGSATLGQVEFESLSLSAIERIEVLRGPASSLYGADGSGGVILLTTRRAGAKPRAEARLAVGGKGAREASFSASARHGDWDGSLSLGHERLEGISALRPGDRFGNFNPDADGMRRDSLQASLGFRPAAGHELRAQGLATRLNSQYDASEFAPPDFAQDPSPDFRTRLKQRVAALAWQAGWRPDFDSLIRAESQASVSRSGGTQIDRFATEREQLLAQADWRPASGQQATLGLELQRERAEANAYPAAQERENRALVLGWVGRWNGSSVQADARHDHNSVYGSSNTGRLGLSQALAEGLRARALVGSSFRAPSFNDLYYPGYGVASIRPERSHSLELGLDASLGAWELGATAFRNRARDLIAYEPDRSHCPADPAYNFGCARNIASARLAGLNLRASTRLGAWSLQSQLDLLDAKDRHSGQRLPRRAAHQASLALDYKAAAWGAGLEALRVGARPDGGITLKAETTLNLKAHWDLGQLAPQWRLEALLRNATDRDLQPVRDYQDLGRQAWLGLRWSL